MFKIVALAQPKDQRKLREYNNSVKAGQLSQGPRTRVTSLRNMPNITPVTGKVSRTQKTNKRTDNKTGSTVPVASTREKNFDFEAYNKSVRERQKSQGTRTRVASLWNMPNVTPVTGKISKTQKR